MGDVLVLCYHALSERWPADLAVTPDRFEEQLEELVGRGYRGVTFSEALADGDGGERRLAVTFDDAYRSVIELGRPVLDRLGLPGTVFVAADFLGSAEPMAWPGIDRWLAGPHEGEMMCMDREQLLELAGAGWEIGSHTSSHPRLPALSDELLAAELAGSRARLEDQLQLPCPSLAYPYGDVDRRVARAAGEAGYETACTLRAWELRRDRLLWPRVGVYQGDTLERFRLKVSPLARRFKLSALRHPIAALRRA
ncbi:MAG TPA: polysaccharide deacetylase family protein [Thermoleophilaceae bacterium]